MHEELEYAAHPKHMRGLCSTHWQLWPSCLAEHFVNRRCCAALATLSGFRAGTDRAAGCAVQAFNRWLDKKVAKSPQDAILVYPEGGWLGGRQPEAMPPCRQGPCLLCQDRTRERERDMKSGRRVGDFVLPT